MKNLSSLSALALASVLGFGLLRQDESAPTPPPPAPAWEYGLLSEWWDKPEGYYFYDYISWSEPGRTVKERTWGELFEALEVDDEQYAGQANLLKAVNFFASQGWELVETHSEAAFEGSSGMWANDCYRYFRRPVR